MRFLITHIDFTPFLTNWYDYETHYKQGMVIYDLYTNKYSIDGVTWGEIDEDVL